MTALHSLTPPYGFTNFDTADFDPEQPWDNYRSLGAIINPLALANGESTIKIALSALSTDAKPGIVKISSQDASTSSSVDFTGLDATYDAYLLVITDVVPGTANANMYIRYGTGATPTWETTGYQYHVGSSRANSTTYASLADIAQAQIRATSTLGTTSGYGLSGHLFIHNPASAAEYKKTIGMLCYMDNTNNVLMQSFLTGLRASVTAITAIRFYMSTGNIASGRFTLYGIKK